MNRLFAIPSACWISFLLLVFASSTGAAIRYVDLTNPTPLAPYTNWITAATNIQDAVDAAVAADEILVTNGVYATGGRTVGTNLLVNRVAVTKALTVRSVNGPDVTTIQGYQVPGTTNGDGAVRCMYLTNQATLIGFTLTNGATRTSGDYERDRAGGGVWCASVSAVLSNCVLAGNSASAYGGGAYSGTLSHCVLTGNSAWEGGGAYASPLTACVLKANSARDGGGASRGSLNYCTLTGNFAEYGGGACDSTLSYCTVTENSALSAGGGAECGILKHCTLTANSASWSGGGAWEASLQNCILYFNSAPAGANWYYCDMINCCSTPLAPGQGNFDADPQLASASHTSEASPCRGSGRVESAPGVDIDGEPWTDPPSVGCDEFHADSTGELRVSLRADFNTIARGFPAGFVGSVDGPATASRWDFGDGTVVSNRPFASHAWAAPGDYAVVFQAFNADHAGGMSATSRVQVIEQPVHYVALDSPGAQPPYATWATAARNIQDAVDATSVGGALVLVSNGVYQTGGRVVDGMLTNRVVVRRGLTLRSVNGPDVTTIQGYQVPGTTNGASAVRCVRLADEAILIGFTLANGATASWEDDYERPQGIFGGGVWCESVSAVLSNCVLTGNSAQSLGGGSLGGTLDHCILARNYSPLAGGGAYGSVLDHCILTGNHCANDMSGGGGAAASAILNYCVLTGNSSDGWGGGAQSSTLDDCVLTGNSASYYGGGASGGTLRHCTVTGNSTHGEGGGASYATLEHCIVYDNWADWNANWTLDSSWPEGGALSYCCTTPLPPGDGNLTNAPLFVNAAGGDFRLQADSPCINAGRNGYVSSAFDLDGLPRIVGGTVDVGAYEYQTPASAISYAWLQQYGLLTDGSADATDPDLDGLSTRSEWIAGTDPTNAVSSLRMLSASATGAGATVRWTSVTNRTYALERAVDLGLAPAFALVKSNLPGQASITAFTDTNAPGDAPRFYRVQVVR